MTPEISEFSYGFATEATASRLACARPSKPERSNAACFGSTPVIENSEPNFRNG
jgi:hypothetical protein